MRRRKPSAAAAAFVLAAAFLMANPESLPAAVTGADSSVFAAAADVTYWVSPTGSNANSGTGSSVPLATLHRAFFLARKDNAAGRSVRIVLRNGIYHVDREAAFDSSQGGTAAYLILEAEHPGAAVITGAQRWNDGWTPSTTPGGNVAYRHDWPYDKGTYEGLWNEHNPKDPHAHRVEMIYVDGQRLLQVLSRRELDDAGRGTFYVDEANDRIHVRPPSGQPLPVSVISVATAPEIPAWQKLVRLKVQANVAVRGLVFEHAAVPLGRAAFQIEGAGDGRPARNVLVEDLVSRANNGIGMSLVNARGVTLKRVQLVHNGEKGFSTNKVENLLVEDFEVSYNCWRVGGYGHYYAWAAGALKLTETNDAVFARVSVVNNECTGFWTDISNRRIELTDLLSTGSMGGRAGVYFEVSYGPHVLRNSQILRNRGPALLVAAVAKTVVENNVISGNESALSSRTDNRVPTDWKTGAELNGDPEDFLVRGNRIIVEDRRPGQVFLRDISNWGSDWQRMSDVSIFRENKWTHPTNATPFRDRNGKAITFEAWSALPRKGQGSTFSSAREIARLVSVSDSRSTPVVLEASDWTDTREEDGADAYLFPGTSPESGAVGPKHQWEFDNVSGTNRSAVRVVPDVGAFFGTDRLGSAPRVSYDVLLYEAGTYTVWVRGRANDGASDSVHVGIDGEALSGDSGLTGFHTAAWSWEPLQVRIDRAGFHTIDFWAREDGFAFSHVLLTRDPSFAPDDPPNPSPRRVYPPLSTLAAGRTEAEQMAAVNFTASPFDGASGGLVVANASYGSALLAGTFSGAPGQYSMNIGYVDEEDGIATWVARVDGAVVDSWRGDQGGGGGPWSRGVRVISDVSLASGSVVEVVGLRGGGELARVDFVEIVPN